MRTLSLACLLLGVNSLPAQTGCIQGDVRDAEGTRIPYAHVIAAGPDHFRIEISTDAEGFFQMDAVPAGGYQVIASDEPLIYRKVQFAAGFGTKVVAPADAACASAGLQLPTRARLRITATDLLTAAPISLPDARFRLDANGNWEGVMNEDAEILVPPGVDLEILVSALGYEAEHIKVSSLSSREERDLAVRLPPVQNGCITGTVTDKGGVPVGGVGVQVNLDPVGPAIVHSVPSVTTDKNGHFRFDPVEPGAYVIFTDAVSLGYPIDQGTGKLDSISVSPGAGCADITLNLGPKAGNLQLAVVDAATQVPLEFSASASGDHPSGGWTLRVMAHPMPVPAFREFRVMVDAPGYQQQTVTVSPLQPEELRNLRIELKPTASPER